MPKRNVLKFIELNNFEIFEIASSIKLISAALEKAFRNSSTVIYFSEYESSEIEDEFSIGHFHIHLVPKDNSDPKANDIYPILEGDDKDFIVNFNKKFKNASIITEQNINSLHEDGKKIMALVTHEIELGAVKE